MKKKPEATPKGARIRATGDWSDGVYESVVAVSSNVQLQAGISPEPGRAPREHSRVNVGANSVLLRSDTYEPVTEKSLSRAAFTLQAFPKSEDEDPSSAVEISVKGDSLPSASITVSTNEQEGVVVSADKKIILQAKKSVKLSAQEGIELDTPEIRLTQGQELKPLTIGNILEGLDVDNLIFTWKTFSLPTKTESFWYTIDWDGLPSWITTNDVPTFYLRAVCALDNENPVDAHLGSYDIARRRIAVINSSGVIMAGDLEVRFNVGRKFPWNDIKERLKNAKK